MPWIVAAYVVVPISAAIAALARALAASHFQAELVWLLVLFCGLSAAAVLAAELVFVTPILVGFSRYRWRWLNGWSGGAVGIMTAMLVTGLLQGGLPTANIHQTTITIAANGALTVQTSWTDFLVSQAEAAILGLFIALTFRILAVRKTAIGEASPHEP